MCVHYNIITDNFLNVFEQIQLKINVEIELKAKIIFLKSRFQLINTHFGKCATCLNAKCHFQLVFYKLKFYNKMDHQ